MISRYVMYVQANAWYALGIMLLSVASLAMLGYELLATTAEPALISRLQQYDVLIAWIFLTDFFLGLFFNRGVDTRTYWRQNWLNLVSSIPVTSDATRLLRILRVLRAFRVIRASMNFWFARARWRRNRRSMAAD